MAYQKFHRIKTKCPCGSTVVLKQPVEDSTFTPWGICKCGNYFSAHWFLVDNISTVHFINHGKVKSYGGFGIMTGAEQ